MARSDQHSGAVCSGALWRSLALSGALSRSLALFYALSRSFTLSRALWRAFVGLDRAPGFGGLVVPSIAHVFERRGPPGKKSSEHNPHVFDGRRGPTGKDLASINLD